MTKIDKMSMSRMFADTPAELDAMAARVGLDPLWKIQADSAVEHFLLTVNKRMMAVRNGAIVLNTVEVIERLRSRHDGTQATAQVAPEWEKVRHAFAEMGELTTAVEGTVPTAGVREAVRVWVNGMRRVVSRIAKEHRI